MTKRWMLCAVAAVSLVLSACADDAVQGDDDEERDDPSSEVDRYDEGDELLEMELDVVRDRIQVPSPWDGDPGPQQPEPLRPSHTRDRIHPDRIPVLAPAPV